MQVLSNLARASIASCLVAMTPHEFPNLIPRVRVLNRMPKLDMKGFRLHRC